jgi:hypothetical protein
MSFIVTITGTTGANTGPLFELYSCTGSTCDTSPFVTGMTRADFSGYTISNVPDGTTKIRCKSTNNLICTGTTDFTISGLPNSSPTPTPTPTSPNTTPTSTPLTPIYSYKLGTGVTSTDACIDYDPPLNINYWSYDSVLDNGTQLYSVGDYPLSGTPPTGYYANGTTVWYFVGGVLVGGTMCTYTPTPTPTPTQLGEPFGIYTGQTYATSGNTCSADGAHIYTGITNVYLGPSDTPSVGDYFYKDTYSTPGNTFVGNGNWYIVKQATPTLIIYACQVGATGQILAVTTCV